MESVRTLEIMDVITSSLVITFSSAKLLEVLDVQVLD